MRLHLLSNYRFLLNEHLFCTPLSYNPSWTIKLGCLVIAARYIRYDLAR